MVLCYFFLDRVLEQIAVAQYYVLGIMKTNYLYFGVIPGCKKMLICYVFIYVRRFQVFRLGQEKAVM